MCVFWNIKCARSYISGEESQLIVDVERLSLQTETQNLNNAAVINSAASQQE